MKGQYTHYLVIPNTSQGLGLRITDRYDWQTFTYKEVERTGTRDVMVELPTEDDLKADIQSFMATHSISGSGTKAELIEAINEHIIENGHQQKVNHILIWKRWWMRLQITKQKYLIL